MINKKYDYLSNLGWLRIFIIKQYMDGKIYQINNLKLFRWPGVKFCAIDAQNINKAHWGEWTLVCVCIYILSNSYIYILSNSYIYILSKSRSGKLLINMFERIMVNGCGLLLLLFLFLWETDSLMPKLIWIHVFYFCIFVICNFIFSDSRCM